VADGGLTEWLTEWLTECCVDAIPAEASVSAGVSMVILFAFQHCWSADSEPVAKFCFSHRQHDRQHIIQTVIDPVDAVCHVVTIYISLWVLDFIASAL
jgi:hypothetical protein